MLLVGLGAVSTTTIAGIMAIRKGISKPIGSLTQMGTVRLGKRTESRSPSIKEFVPISELDFWMSTMFDAAGEADSARVYRERVDRAWRNADPEFRAQVAASLGTVGRR